MRDVKASHVGSVLIEVAAPSDGAARSVLWAYIDDVASRWYGRPATDVEIAAALLDDPSEDLAAARHLPRCPARGNRRRMRRPAPAG